MSAHGYAPQHDHGHHHHDQDIPRGVVLATGVLLGIVMALVAAARLAPARPPAPVSEPIVQSDLYFGDAEDGSVVVTSADGSEVAQLASGTNGFVRGVMRSFARDRRARGIGAEEPFRLAALKDGSLVLTDLATGESVELRSFGATNAATFAALLES